MSKKNRGRKLDGDLRHNPGIGQSQDAYAMGGELDHAEGDNTVEGDVENEAGCRYRAAPEPSLGRTGN